MRLFWKVVAGSLFLAIPAYLWDPHNLFFTWVAAAVGAFSALLNCNGVTPLDWDVSDAMLDPPQDVRDAIRKDPELSLFDACLSDLFNNVEAYGMEAVSARLMIESGENVTIFAPKDSAMACRGVERMVARRNQTGFSGFDGWVSFVLSHVCDDLHDPDDLAQREEVTSIAGQKIRLEDVFGRLGVSQEGLKFKRMKNGIVYKIDKIILPSALELSRACFKEETEGV